ncbi:8-oxo-dGTP pyrophosphatase MutT (NUDIX family) [Novosphingobium capsulatum]|uniref:8-oxo-dGTP pyrophosphatase MutT (NUDIX family) n=1 Tax=Novosphingobium capsulatum TaxID=13688 RepID=A0ABU1MJ78_9SPHN|nr:NUDIX domain-containing protein [Novosphingobium capsulatum]MDR6510126.1 8-oxo-dGTP pyrophosphatase MutT (NUDIX family) [Novosphingobium capsulatum]
MPDPHHASEPTDTALGEPAATLIVFRKGAAGAPAQILLVERSAQLRFAGGATVFPGGKVDAADHALVAQGPGWASGLDADDAAARVAAVRETLEETGLLVGLAPARPDAAALDASGAQQARAILAQAGSMAPVLAHFGWQLDPAALVPWARWWPRGKPGRVFDTRFYLADLGSGMVDLAVDRTENCHLFWASAAEALAAAARGDLRVIFPTRRNLERLALFDDFATASQHAAAHPVVPIVPQTILRDGEPWLAIPDGHGYPVLGEPLAEAHRA